MEGARNCTRPVKLMPLNQKKNPIYNAITSQATRDRTLAAASASPSLSAATRLSDSDLKLIAVDCLRRPEVAALYASGSGAYVYGFMWTVVVYIPLIAGAGADNDAGAAGGAGMDAEDCAGADEGYAAGFDEASAMQQLCELLRRPLADGKSEFSHTSPLSKSGCVRYLTAGRVKTVLGCVRAFSA